MFTLHSLFMLGFVQHMYSLKSTDQNHHWTKSAISTSKLISIRIHPNPCKVSTFSARERWNALAWLARPWKTWICLSSRATSLVLILALGSPPWGAWGFLWPFAYPKNQLLFVQRQIKPTYRPIGDYFLSPGLTYVLTYLWLSWNLQGCTFLSFSGIQAVFPFDIQDKSRYEVTPILGYLTIS